MLNCWEVSNCGGRTVEDRLRELLIKYAQVISADKATTPAAENAPLLGQTVVHDIKVVSCGK